MGYAVTISIVLSVFVNFCLALVPLLHFGLNSLPPASTPCVALAIVGMILFVAFAATRGFSLPLFKLNPDDGALFSMIGLILISFVHGIWAIVIHSGTWHFGLGIAAAALTVIWIALLAIAMKLAEPAGS